MSTTLPMDPILGSNTSLPFNATLATPPPRRGLFELDVSVNFWLLILSMFVGVVWITFLTFFNSRMLGWVLTKLLNRFFIDASCFLSVGSFSVSVLSGKVMVRELLYVTENAIYRIQDGWLVFRYWQCYRPADVRTDFSQRKARLVVSLNGLEVHVFNNVDKYRAIGELYHQNPAAEEDEKPPSNVRGLEGNRVIRWVYRKLGIRRVQYERHEAIPMHERSPASSERARNNNGGASDAFYAKWRDLIPVVKIDVITGRLIFGNHLLPSSFVISYENADMTYTTKPASNPADLFRHILRGKVENLKLSLVKSSQYTGGYEPPPRIMGDEGFTALSSACADFHFSMDETGVVTAGVQRVDTPGDNPYMGIELQLGKGTVINYGPWVERQRERLYGFFYPPDFQTAPETRLPATGQKRVHVALDVKISMQLEANLDVLYTTKNDVVDALHVNMRAGSFCEVQIPWLTRDDGFTTTVNGTLMRVQSFTSLPFRNLLDCETLEFSCDMRYPRQCFDLAHPMDWQLHFTASRSSLWCIFRHKAFVQDLLDDFSSRHTPDIYGHSPFLCNVSMTFREFEVMLLSNQYNWIDTSSAKGDAENSAMALCGQSLRFSMTLPWLEYLPDAMEYDFKFEGEGLLLKMYHPMGSMIRAPFLTRIANAALPAVPDASHNSQNQRCYFSGGKMWAGETLADKGWVEVCHAPLGGTVGLKFKAHMNPVPFKSRYPAFQQSGPSMEKFDPLAFSPDVIKLTVELAPASLILTGLLIQQFLSIKDNYAGEYQEFSEMDNLPSSQNSTKVAADAPVRQLYGHVSGKNFHAPNFRPLSVYMKMTFHSLHGYAAIFRTDPLVPSPEVRLEQLVLEVDKSHTGTMFQLCMSPAQIEFPAASPDTPVGNLLLTGLQFRGHGLFSDYQLPLDAPSVEYAWLQEIVVGELFGAVSIQNVLSLLEFVTSSLLQVDTKEDDYPLPDMLNICAHQMPAKTCSMNPFEPPDRPLSPLSSGDASNDRNAAAVPPCPSEGDLKYRMTRVTVDQICLHLLEGNMAVELNLPPLFKICTCNLHSNMCKTGVSASIPQTKIRQLSRSQSGSAPGSDESWLECAAVKIPPVDANVALPMGASSGDMMELQKKFLFSHDQRSKRLHFLWEQVDQPVCSCRGGSQFFGANLAGKMLFRNQGHAPPTKQAKPVLYAPVPGAPREYGYCQSLLGSSEEPAHALTIAEVDKIVLEKLADQPPTSAKSAKSSGSGKTSSDRFYDARPFNFGSLSSVGSDNASVESFATATASSGSRDDQASNTLHRHMLQPIAKCPPLVQRYGRYMSCLKRQVYVLANCPGQPHLRPVFVFDKDPESVVQLSPLDCLKLTDSRPHQPRLYPVPEGAEQVLHSSKAGTRQLEVKIVIRESAEIFVSPLAVDLMTGAFETLSRIHRHPLSYVAAQLAGCAIGDHKDQVICRPTTLAAPTTPLQIHVKLPAVNVVMLQAGIMDKTVGLGAAPEPRVSASALVWAVNDLECCATSVQLATAVSAAGEVPGPGQSSAPLRGVVDSGGCPVMTIGELKMDSAYFQLVQIDDSDKDSGMGLSASASKLPYRLQVPETAAEYRYARGMVEGGVERVVVNVEYHHQRNEPDGLDACSAPNSNPATPPPENRSFSAGASSPASEQSTVHWPCADYLFVNVDHAALNCALGVPADQAADHWPLYDILSPGINSWLYVKHRLSDCAKKSDERKTKSCRVAMAHLLAAAWQSHRSLGTPKKLKYRRHFTDCPSCYLCWTVLRMASMHATLGDDVLLACTQFDLSDGAAMFLVDRSLSELLGALQTEFIQSASVACSKVSAELRHWISKQLQENSQMQNSSANAAPLTPTTPVGSIPSHTSASVLDEVSTGIKRPLLAKTKSVDASMGKSPPAPPDPAPCTQPGPDVGKMREQLYDFSTRRQSFLDQAEKAHTRRPSATFSKTASTAIPKPPTQKASQNEEEPFYTWMQRETHAALRRKEKMALRNVEHTEEGAWPDLDVLPTELFFERTYLLLQLDVRRSPVVTLIEEKLTKLSCSLNLKALDGVLIEPRINTRHSLKVVSHTERPCLTIRDLGVNVDVEYKFADQLPDGSGMGSMLEVNYHGRLPEIKADFGVTIAALLNQLSFVARSALATYAELRDTAAKSRKSSMGVFDSPKGGETPEPDARTPMTQKEFESDTGSLECLIPEKQGKAVRFRRKFRKTTKDQKESGSGNPDENLTDWTAEKAMDVIRQFALDFRSHDPIRAPRRLVSMSKDNCQLVVLFGVIDIPLITLTANLSGLAFRADFHDLQLGHSLRSNRQVVSRMQISREMSLTSDVKKIVIDIRDSRIQNQAVVELSVEESQVLFSEVGTLPPKGSLLLEIGPVSVGIPLNPGILHGVVVRGTQQIADTLKDLKTPGAFEDAELNPTQEAVVGEYARRHLSSRGEVDPVDFCVIVRSVTITASLLPSLKAIYRMGEATAAGSTVPLPKFTFRLPNHCLTFDLAGLVESLKGVSHEPESTIEIFLPELNAEGGQVREEPEHDEASVASVHKKRLGLGIKSASGLLDDISEDKPRFRKGSFLKVNVRIGKFMHTLTTDLLNQMLFIEEAFMRELSEVIQKITSAKRPQTFIITPTQKGKTLYAIDIVIEKIQITATTPTSTAVRLETDSVMFQLSNRLIDASHDDVEKVFGVAEITLCVSLGQFIRHAIYEEVVPEFDKFAWFKTKIQMRNAPSSVANEIRGSTAYLISLESPSIFVLPVALDKAILLWINYKNAYDFWSEQRQKVRAKSPRRDTRSEFAIPNMFEQISSPNMPSVSPLFLQVKVEHGISICMPLFSAHYSGVKAVEDTTSALIISLDDTGIAVCTYGALVSTGRFSGFCVTIVDNVDPHADDWRPDLDSRKLSDLNCCYVPEGTYNVCSQTVAPTADRPGAEWILNVDWYMKGVEINLNTQVGKAFSLLISTLTSLTGDEDDRAVMASARIGNMSPQGEPLSPAAASQLVVPSQVPQPPSIDTANLEDATELRSAMQAQTQYVHELEVYGADEMVLENERRKIQQLEAYLSRQFRSDMRQKLKQQSRKATNLKDRFGLVYKGNQPYQVVTEKSDTALADKGAGRSRPPLLRRKTERDADALTGRRAQLRQRTTSFDNNLPSPITEEGDESESASEANEESPAFTPANPSDQLSFDYSTPIQKQQPKQPKFFIDAQPSSGTTGSSRDLTGGEGLNDLPVNFYLDFKVHVEKGQCRLRTEESKQKEGKDMRRSNKNNNPPAPGYTLIAIPGLNVKSLYVSKADQGSSLRRETLMSCGISSGNVMEDIMSSSKKAQFCLWLSLESSMPEATEISPHLLEFVEQAMEPFNTDHKATIRSASNPASTTGAPAMGPDHEAAGSAYQWDVAMMQTPASFPVDVLVFLNVQSSAIRFSCQPHSLVECLVNLPELSVVATSRKVSPDEAPSPVPRSAGLRRDDDVALLGGINVTVTLSDFALYTFHQYSARGAGKIIDERERRDSLSLRLSSAVINISRSRNTGMSHSSSTQPRLAGFTGKQPEGANAVRFSLLVDLGKATFVYDMRRLHEILEFPRAWYSRTIMRRFFLGDSSMMTMQDPTKSAMERFGGTSSGGSDITGSDPNIGVLESIPESPRKQPSDQRLSTLGSTDTTLEPYKWTALVLYAFNFDELNIQTNMGTTMGRTNWVTKTAGSQGHLALDSSGNRKAYISMSLKSSVMDSQGGWVSGNIALQDLAFYGWLEEAPVTEPKHCLGASLKSSEAKLEWMGTSIFMGFVNDLSLDMKDDWRLLVKTPSSPSPSTLSKTPKFDIAGASDQSFTQTQDIGSSDGIPGPKARDEASVDFLGTIHWNQLQIMISRATVTDLVKIVNKVHEFFHNEFKHGRDMFVSFPSGRSGRDDLENIEEVDEEQESSLRYHRYWHKPLDLISHFLYQMQFPMPAKGLSLGGSLDLVGNEIVLACFQERNFRAPKWALFHMRYPSINFCSHARDEVKEVDKQLVISTKIHQNLSFVLGDRSLIGPARSQKPMATVLQVQRTNAHALPQVSSIHEWFDYTFRSVLRNIYGDEYGFGRFPTNPDGSSATSPTRSASISGRDYRHSVADLFRLPPLRMSLRTSQIQGQEQPGADDPAPIIDFAFTTEFDDFVYVRLDAEAYVFLADIVRSYMSAAEQEQQHASSMHAGPETKRMEHPTKELQKDAREFVCSMWTLEPKVRFLDASESTPFGVDHMLKRFGFQQAKITIPKWTQRGFMDPLDSVLAHMLELIVMVSRRKS